MQQRWALLLTDSWARMSVWIWKNSSACVVWVSRCLRGDSLLVHPLVYLGNTSLFSEEDFPLCCQAFTKVLIAPIFGFLYLQGLWILGPLSHLQRALVPLSCCRGELGGHLYVAWSCSGVFDTCWCLFSRLSVCFYRQIGRTALFFSLKHSLWFPRYFECYNSIKHHGVGPWPRLVQTQWCSLAMLLVKVTLLLLWCP